MSWQLITENTEGTSAATAAGKVVGQLSSQIEALGQFLAETEEIAASNPHLQKMRSDVEAVYDDATSTLDQISKEDLNGAGNFYSIGALSLVSNGLQLTIEIPDTKEGGGAVANFYRVADIHNSEGVLAIEDPSERAAYIEERQSGWANSEVLQSMRDTSYSNNAFALATLDAQRAKNDPSYTPNTDKSFSDVTNMSEKGFRIMSLSVHGEGQEAIATDPIDLDAIMLYRSAEAMNYADIQANAAVIMPPEMQADVQEINMNVIARALNGEYGDKIEIPGEIDNDNKPINIAEIDPRDAIRALAYRAGVTFNPLYPPYGSLDIYRDPKSHFVMPSEEHIADYIFGDFTQEQDAYPERLERIANLLDAADGQRVSIEDFYVALDKDPSGPDFDLPPLQTMQLIERDIGRLEERISILEKLVKDPTAQNFQDILQDNSTTIETLMLGIKRDMQRNRYNAGLDKDTYSRMYEESNFDGRVEALLGVPLDKSRSMTYEGSPLLQAFEINFHTFHPPKLNASEVPSVRDGTSQLGAALSERGGAVIIDDHYESEPMQFMYDSLAEIASHGPVTILLENSGGFRPEGGLIDLTRTYDPLEIFYETGDPSALDQYASFRLVELSERNEITQLLDRQESGLSEEDQARLSLLQKRYPTSNPEDTRLSPDEETKLTELEDRQALFKKMIVEGYNEHGIQFQFFGGKQEENFDKEFGFEARMVTTNIGWDQKFENASEGYDNVVIFGGGAHFVEGLGGVDHGKMGLDENRGYPKFSLANPGGLLRGQGDYNLAPTESGRWVQTSDPLAVEMNAPTPTVAPDTPTITPQQ